MIIAKYNVIADIKQRSQNKEHKGFEQQPISIAET